MYKKTVIMLLCITVLFGITFMIQRSYAKYLSAISGNAKTGTAIYIFNDSLDELNYFLGEFLPGETKRFNFVVKNFTHNKVGQVNIDYSFKIENSDNIPAEILLYKNGIEQTILNYDESTNSLISGLNRLNYGVNTTDNYQLVIAWNNELNDSAYNGLTDYLDITIESKQVLE